MDAARITWDTPLPSPSHPFLFFSLISLPTLPSPYPLWLSLPCAVLLQLSRCWVFALLPVLLCAVCFSACQGLGSCVLSLPFPPPFSFLCSACLLCAPLACCLPLFSLFFLLFPRCFVVAGCPCSLPSFPPPFMCVCARV